MHNREFAGDIVAATYLRVNFPTAQELIDRFTNITMDSQRLPIQDLDANVESRLRFSLQNSFLTAASARFFVTQSDGLNAAYEIDKGRIFEQIFKSISVSCSNQHHAPLVDGASGSRFLLSAY